MRRRRRLWGWCAGLALVGAVFLPFPIVPADVIETSILLIEQDETRDEDVFVAARSGRIEGRIDGDLVIAVEDLIIDGVVTGDVFLLSHGSVRIGGTVDGSVRGAVRSLEVSGLVGDDLAVVAQRIEVTGSVGRDLLAVGGGTTLAGGVGRDVRGRVLSLDVDGPVGGDVDVEVRTLELGADAAVDGDVTYRADDDATVAGTARVDGAIRKATPRGSFLVRLYLAIARAVGFILFVLLGFVAIWLFRRTSARAAGLVVTRPGLTLLVGLAAGVVLPFLLLLLVSLVGSPLALVVVATIVGLLALAVLVTGPVPALAAVGDLLTGRRAGLFGGFLVGAGAWWLLASLVPFAGAVLGLALYTWGIGAWLTAGWRQRARALEAAPLVPLRSRKAGTAPPADWEPPLPPSPAS